MLPGVLEKSGNGGGVCPLQVATTWGVGGGIPAGAFGIPPNGSPGSPSGGPPGGSPGGSEAGLPGGLGGWVPKSHPIPGGGPKDPNVIPPWADADSSATPVWATCTVCISDIACLGVAVVYSSCGWSLSNCSASSSSS